MKTIYILSRKENYSKYKKLFESNCTFDKMNSRVLSNKEVSIRFFVASKNSLCGATPHFIFYDSEEEYCILNVRYFLTQRGVNFIPLISKRLDY